MTYKLVPGEGEKIRVAVTYGYEHAANVVQAAMEDYRAHFGGKA
jgi:inorganic pyrophosphatase